MPSISQSFELKVTPERFVKACSDLELYDLWLLMLRADTQQKLRKMDGTAATSKEVIVRPTAPDPQPRRL